MMTTIMIASFKRILKEARKYGIKDDDQLAEYLSGYLDSDITSDTKAEWLMDFEDGVLDSFITLLPPDPPKAWDILPVDLNPEDY